MESITLYDPESGTLLELTLSSEDAERAIRGMSISGFEVIVSKMYIIYYIYVMYMHMFTLYLKLIGNNFLPRHGVCHITYEWGTKG